MKCFIVLLFSAILLSLSLSCSSATTSEKNNKGVVEAQKPTLLKKESTEKKK